MKKNLIPEWAPTAKILLVWPEELYKKEVKCERIIEFYVSLINSLTSNKISVSIISVLKNKVSSIRARFEDPNNPEVVYKNELSKISDIWIRDFAPFYKKTEDDVIAVKTHYKPSYAYSSKEREWCARNEEASYYLSSCRIEKAERNGHYLILDGGNLVHNGLGTGIVTNRVLSDNSSLFEHEIRDIFRENLGISELYIIPAEPEDDTGHIDGLVRFLDPNTLLVEDYPDKPPEGKIFTDKIAGYLSQQGFNVYRIRSAKPRKGKHKASGKCSGNGTFENAAGNYLNFLRVNDKIFLPRYNIPEDDEALQQLQEIFDNKSQCSKIFRVEKDATPLSEFGGVINCITSHLFETDKLSYHPFEQFIPVAKTGSSLMSDGAMFLAVRDSSKNRLEDYWNNEVIQVNFRERKIFPPNNLQKICNYLHVIPLDPEIDDKFNFTEHLLLFEPSQLRKMWQIFKVF